MRTLGHLLHKAVEKIVAEYQPERIILFGSRAKGDFDQESDADFLIIKETSTRPLERLWEVERILRDRLLPMDIIILTPKELAARLEAKDPFITEILEEGITIYEKSR
jgi:predicted nucleotidyltransferase